jgi:CRISPR/Cas system-associated exonuclease Cas4 (RecB family)
MSEQMSLFNKHADRLFLSESDDSSVVKWSYSRREVMERCLRWYYNRYYGSNSRMALSEPQKPLLRFLKSLSNRYERTGKIAHLVISTYLNRLKLGEKWELERLLRWAQDIYQGDLEYSRDYKSTKQAADNTSSVLLSEFYYNLPDAEVIWEASSIQLRNALVGFFTNPAFLPFRAGGARENSLLEKRVYLKKKSFVLEGQLDLAYWDKGRLVVVDWKSGRSNGSEDSLQLSSYALLAIQEYGCNPDDIDLYRAHLSDGVVSKFTVNEREIERTRGRILQDIERMRLMHSYGRDGISKAFTPCEQPRICALCPFQEVCLSK